MNLQEFVEEHRPDIIQDIKNVDRKLGTSDKDIEDWVRNDEIWYNIALLSGVPI